jgi:riboflavin kinase/FMN adenylyltransferase
MTLRAYRSAGQWRQEAGAKATVAAIGNFDGVHRGHQQILSRVIEEARSKSALAAVATFDPHPTRVLRRDSAPALITTLEQRLALFEAAGVDAALVIPFTAEFARLSPEEFATQILAETLHCSVVFVGGNFRFGHRQEGDPPLLTQLGERLGFAVDVVPAVRLRGQVVSSTLVRRAIATGRVERGGRMLGRPFALTGEIRPGTGQGRKLVVPTLNLNYEQELIPGRGVYATESIVGGKLYRSATNVGLRPTFQGHVLTVESHLLDFSEEVRSGRMEVRFWKRLRDEQRFHSPEELRQQVLRDVDRARRFFARLDRWRRQPAATPLTG